MYHCIICVAMLLYPKAPPTHMSILFITMLKLWIQIQFILLRPQHSSAAPTSDPAQETVQSELTDLLHPDPDNLTPSPTSPLCLGKIIFQSSLSLSSKCGFKYAAL